MKVKVLHFVIKAVVEYPLDEPESIGDLLDEIRQYGEADIVSTEIIEVER